MSSIYLVWHFSSCSALLLAHESLVSLWIKIRHHPFRLHAWCSLINILSSPLLGYHFTRHPYPPHFWTPTLPLLVIILQSLAHSILLISPLRVVNLCPDVIHSHRLILCSINKGHCIPLEFALCEPGPGFFVLLFFNLSGKLTIQWFLFSTLL